jgi:hypothetical protein
VTENERLLALLTSLRDFPLEVHHDVAWVGYATAHLRTAIESVLARAAQRRGFV